MDFCYRELPYELDPFDTKTFSEDPMEFYVGATDVETGKCTFHLCTDGKEEDMLWLRAAASMPAVSIPVPIDGHLYLDGGISDAVPYAYMEQVGYDRNVIILTQPKGYRKKPVPAHAMKLLFRKMPKIAEAMRNRHIMYNRQMDELDEMEDKKSALILRPPVNLGIGHTEKDPKELERVYQIGRGVAEERLGEIRSWLTTRSDGRSVSDIPPES